MLTAQDQISYLVRPDPTNPLFTPVIGCLIAGSNSTYKNGVSSSLSFIYALADQTGFRPPQSFQEVICGVRKDLLKSRSVHMQRWSLAQRFSRLAVSLAALWGAQS